MREVPVSASAMTWRSSARGLCANAVEAIDSAATAAMPLTKFIELISLCVGGRVVHSKECAIAGKRGELVVLLGKEGRGRQRLAVSVVGHSVSLVVRITNHCAAAPRESRVVAAQGNERASAGRRPSAAARAAPVI